MVKKSESEAKTQAKDENSTFIVNPLLLFMKHRFKSTILVSTLQLMLQYYNAQEECGKGKINIEDIYAVIVEMDDDPNNSLILATETTDFPILNFKHIDAASLYHKIIQLSKEVEQQREVKTTVMRISISMLLI